MDDKKHVKLKIRHENFISNESVICDRSVTFLLRKYSRDDISVAYCFKKCDSLY